MARLAHLPLLIALSASLKAAAQNVPTDIQAQIDAALASVPPGPLTKRQAEAMQAGLTRSQCLAVCALPVSRPRGRELGQACRGLHTDTGSAG